MTALNPRFTSVLPRRFPTLTLRTLIALCVSGCGIPQPTSNDEERSQLEALTYRAPTGKVTAIANPGAEGLPRVIFVHGTPGDKEAFVDFLVQAPEGRHYISIDRPGFGGSAPDAAETSLKAQAAALVPLLEPHGGNKPILVGHSLGGPLALRAAIDFPEKLAALVILAGSADPELEKIHFAQYLGASRLGRAVLPRPIENSNDELFAHEAELEAMQPHLAGITLPIVILHGTEDGLVPVENVPYMRRELAGADVHVTILEGGNHFLPWNAVDDVKVAIEQAVRMGWSL